MVRARKFVVVNRYQGKPKLSDYKIVEQELPPLKNGEILVKAEFFSLDPYQLFSNKEDEYIKMEYKKNPALRHEKGVPFDQDGFQVGIVLESKNAKFPVGTHVISHKGWADHFIADPDAPVAIKRESIRQLDNPKGLPLSYYMGAVGMPGASAHVGLLDVTQPKPGETVVVTGASGAVGNIVGQIAKIKGCRVIGFAGSNDKVQWLEKELGFDKAYNYKTVDITAALQDAAPNGVDIYFDNVGGEISSLIIKQMNPDGRVSVCGSISSYHDAVLPKVTILQPFILFKSLMIKGFVIWRYDHSKWEAAFDDLMDWIKSGQLKVKEHVVEGFDRLPEAFIGMLDGKNAGKAIVKA